jgi:wobble nucleotide-excising tRNase
MIKKFETINNLAVFEDFIWDNSVKDKDGNVLDFKTINIIYGRNYSGKTTLSRIVRALETGSISNKYINPEFKVVFDDGSSINQSQLDKCKFDIRVFNEDFVRDNLSFLMDTNNDGEIKSFAILGDDNAKIQSEIDSIKKILGSNEEGDESGLYKEKVEKIKAFQDAETNYKKAKQQLENKLSAKATTDRNIAIKYKPEIYGDQNYNVTKLNNDIQAISQNYNPISDTEKEKYHALIKETLKNTITPISEIQIDLQKITEEAKNLVEQKVGDSQKIEELVRNAELNRWVKEGRKYHKDKKLTICSFCGNPISSERWALLDKHFDEESEKLEIKINNLYNQLTEHEKRLNAGLEINKSGFYSKFHIDLDSIDNEYNNEIKSKALESINSLKTQLKQRRDNLFVPGNYKDVYDFTHDLTILYEKYHQVEKDSNDYSSKLSSEQTEAREQLRLNEVYRFIQEIKYYDELKSISELESTYKTKGQEKEEVIAEIKKKEDEISSKLSLMNDEEKGAKKVDEYLKEYFGHHYLSLSAKEENDSFGKHYKFEILRNGDVAYNLSEGECSLIAFCYFMAKLEDVATHNKRPIIWIDDPISSLDSNHVFFIYSLINGKIVAESKFQQLFVSTHNLDFLKYLKRLPGAYNDRQHKVNSKAQFLIIDRVNNKSSIQSMPLYLHAHITEFNYLFKQVYDCATISTIDDTNYTVFYNFGNNARKFLELYLYYKYPDETKDEEKRKKFFGDEIESIITGRLTNEYSHLCGIIERGEQIVEVPEMKNIAQLIITTIKRKDEEQFNALLNSIGVTE